MTCLHPAAALWPQGSQGHPHWDVTAFHGSNRRSEDGSSASPLEAENGDLRRLLPQRQGGE